MQKIAVVGSSGSGKTTFSKALSLATGLPLFHLDAIWWNADKTHISRDAFDEKLAAVLALDRWIIDGDYSRTYEARFSQADAIFFLNYPLEVCLGGIRDRVGQKRSDMPWIESTLDPDFREWVITWHREKLPVLQALLEKYQSSARVITFTSREEAEAFLDELKNRRGIE